MMQHPFLTKSLIKNLLLIKLLIRHLVLIKSLTQYRFFIKLVVQPLGLGRYTVPFAPQYCSQAKPLLLALYDKIWLLHQSYIVGPVTPQSGSQAKPLPCAFCATRWLLR